MSLKKIENGEYSYPFVYSKFVQTDFAGSEECISVLRQRYENKDLSFLESSSHSGVDTVRYNIYGNGERLGFGKGYYDRFLESFNGITVGLSFEECLSDSIPMEEHDKKIDYLITDKKIYKIL